jgi:hypothetical protein
MEDKSLSMSAVAKKINIDLPLTPRDAFLARKRKITSLTSYL